MYMQLNPPIPLETPKGKAWAIAMIDYGPHWDLQWITFLKDSGECWTFSNQDIRQEKNYTFGIPAPSPFTQANGHGSMNGAMFMPHEHVNGNGRKLS